MTTPESFAPGYRLTDGNQLNFRIANPQWSTTSSVSATAGGTVITSAKVVNAVTNITSASAPGAGITLPQAIEGTVLLVSNNSANDVRIFAEGDSDINGLDGQIGILLTKGTTGIFTAVATKQWSQLNTTNSPGLTVIPTIAALRLSAVNTTQTVFVEGYYAKGDGGGGDFYGTSGAAPGTYVDNGGTIIVPTGGDGSSAWLRVVNGPLNFLWFGAKRGNIGFDNTDILRKALKAATGSTLFVPKGYYYIEQSIGALPGGQSSIPLRTTLLGDGPADTIIVYANHATAQHYMFILDDVDTVTIQNIGFTYAAGATGQNSTCFFLSGDNGPVTNVLFDHVYISSFRQYGICLNRNAYYIDILESRFQGITNSADTGNPPPTILYNAIALAFADTAINVVKVINTRFLASDVAIDSGSAKKYTLEISGCAFEAIGKDYTPPGGRSFTVKIGNWNGVDIHANYFEANYTGTGASDSVMLFDACFGVSFRGNFIVSSYGGIKYSYNLIGIINGSVGVTISNSRLEDAINKIVYSSTAGSIARLERNFYMQDNVELTSYDDVMNMMSANLVEVDVPKIVSVDLGSIAAKTAAYADVTIQGLPTNFISTIVANPELFGSNFVLTPTQTTTNTVRLRVFNTDSSARTFGPGNIWFRMWKHGSY